LGWNKEQLASGQRVLLLAHDEPLNMSYGEKPASGFTAAEILNTWEEKVIADVLFGYGEERYARKASLKRLWSAASSNHLRQRSSLSRRSKTRCRPSYRHGRIHPATKSFQALRIAVNDELGAIEKGIRRMGASRNRRPLVVITFHSIEDRLVKDLLPHLLKKTANCSSKTINCRSAQKLP
jgi:16S rRNA (cytosine1402-N4)-methyltransferase